jgi:hypothetical protein
VDEAANGRLAIRRRIGVTSVVASVDDKGAPVSQVNVVPLHPFGDAEALAWMGEQFDGNAETTITDLARKFGWSRGKLRRRLASWTEAGHITQRPSSTGKLIIAPATEPARPLRAGGLGLTRQAAARLVERAFSIDVAPGHDLRRSPLAIAGAALLVVTAVAMALVGLVMNARFAASFGQTAEAAALLAMIGLAIDVLAVSLPSVAAQLWHGRSRSASAVAWSIWLIALTMSLLAAAGFASTNIGDAVAGRARIAGENSTLTERIARLKAERAGIAETRPVAAIEAEMQRAQPAAQGVWKITDGCHDVTRPRSGRACEPILALREAQATAERRDAIDATLREAETRLASLPAIVTADPQAKSAAEIVTWITAGRVSPAAQDIVWLRTIGLAVMPSLAGLIIVLALSLARAKPN